MLFPGSSGAGSNSCSSQKVIGTGEFCLIVRSPSYTQLSQSPDEVPEWRSKGACVFIRDPCQEACHAVPLDHPLWARSCRNALSLLSVGNFRSARSRIHYLKERNGKVGWNSPAGAKCTDVTSAFPAVFSGRSPRSQRPSSCSAPHFRAPVGCTASPFRRGFGACRHRPFPGCSSSWWTAGPPC